MKKWIVTIIACALLSGLVVFAEEIAEIFDFNTLGDKAIENSLELESKTLTLESKKIDQEDTERDASNADQQGGDRVTYINNRTIVESDTILADMEVKLAEMAIEKEKEDLKKTLNEKGMAYNLLLEEIKLNKMLLANYDTYIKNVEVKESNGIATSIDVTNIIIEKQNQALKVKELEGSLRDKAIELNHLLGRELDEAIVIEDTIEAYPLVNFDPAVLYEKRYETYPNIYRKTVELESKEIIFNLNAERYTEDEKEYKTALYNKNIAEVNLDSAKKDYEVALRSAVNDYLNANDSLALTRKQSELKTKQYDDTKLKYDLGLANSEELLKAEEAMKQGEYDVVKAIYNYNVALLAVENLY